MLDDRAKALSLWAQNALNLKPDSFGLTPLSGDASFRRYFRLHLKHSHAVGPDSQCNRYVLMDSPPENENPEAFIRISDWWHQRGITVPKLLARDPIKGFVLLEDLGDNLLLDALSKEPRTYLGLDARMNETETRLYEQALALLSKIQQLEWMDAEAHGLSLYSADALYQEMALFHEWFLPQFLPEKVDSVKKCLEPIYRRLIEMALKQPRVVVHRDFHSRNLMLVGGELVAIDYQDAVWGPMTYDLVSLLRDCYVQWGESTQRRFLQRYFEQLDAQSKQSFGSLEGFVEAYECMGVQRHLKVLGIFTRLYVRDAKPRYLQDIPRVIHYLQSTLVKYDWLRPLLPVIQDSQASIAAGAINASAGEPV